MTVRARALAIGLLAASAACGGGSEPSPAGHHAISGAVTLAGGGGLAGVTVGLSGAAGASTVTGADGTYAFSGLVGGAYTLTPSLTGYTFAPASQAVTLAEADVAGQDFTALAAGLHLISGHIGGPLAVGVEVQLGGAATATAVTDAAGAFAFPDLADGAYTVTPVAQGTTFTPASRGVTLSGADATGADFDSAPDAVTLFDVGGTPEQIVSGPDGNLWYTDPSSDSIVRLTPAGVRTAFPLPGTTTGVWGLAAVEGGVAFTETAANKVGVLRVDGTLLGEWDVPTARSQPMGIAAGPDGALYFAEAAQSAVNAPNRIGVVTGWAAAGDPAFAVADYALSIGGRRPLGIASAAPYDNTRVFFTESLYGEVGTFRTTLAAAGPGPSRVYSLPATVNNTAGIVAGPNDSMWFTEPEGNAIGEVTMAGVVTEHALPISNSNPLGIAVGPDGALWFAEASSTRIGRITATGAISERDVGVPAMWIAAGADGNLWFTSNSTGKVGRLVP